MAMPIRLVVRDDQADWAECILSGNFEAAAELEQIPAEMTPERVILGCTWRRQTVGTTHHSFLFLFAGDLLFANALSSQAFT
jgi:hypothetical protein